MRSSRQPECDESRLAVLLEGDDRSDAYRRSAEHVESCAHCRERLTALAADGATWREVSDLLGGYENDVDVDEDRTESRDFERLADASSDSINARLDFLSAPTHPEMLGRLGRHEIERTIGAGGMGIVLKGHDTELHRPVAIKVLAPHLAHSGAARQRFAREGRAAAAVVHEHVVAIHDVESQADVPFLVMQYVSGESLQTRVDRRGPLDVKEVLRIGAQAAAGLAAAHAQGVVHRDVKPSNILLENGVDRALLTDFGLARVADDASMTRSGIVAGTPHYMSPEQASGASVDHRSDLFGLGSVLYFMATGRPPFRAEHAMAVLHRICHQRHRPAWEVNPDIPDELSDLIDRLLRKKPQQRFADAGAVQAALLELLEDLQRPGRRRRPIHRWLRRRGRRPLLVACAIGAVAALGVGGIRQFGVGETEDGRKPEEAIGAVGAGESIGRIASELRDAGVIPVDQFDDELSVVKRDLERTEALDAVASYRFLQQADADWPARVSAIDEHLRASVKSTFESPVPKGGK